MHQEGHYGAALLAYAPLGFVAIVLGFPTLAVIGAGGSVVLAMVPDWDQRVPGIEHRGLTHTVWFALLVGASLGIAGGAVGAANGGLFPALGLGLFGLLVGTVTICSHIGADALTPAGVEPFAPVDDRHVTYDLVRAKNPLANYGLLLLGGATAGAAGVLAFALVGTPS